MKTKARESRRLATALQLAAEADYQHNQHSSLLVYSLMLARKSMAQCNKLSIYSFQADQVMRLAMALLPRPKGVLALGGQATITASNPDRRYLAIASTKRVVRVWDMHGPRELAPVTLEEPITALAFNRATPPMLAIAGQRSVQVYDAARGQLLPHPINPGAVVSALAFRTDGNTVITLEHSAQAPGTNAGTVVRSWSADTGKEIIAARQLPGEAVISANGQSAVYVDPGHDGAAASLRVVDSGTGQEQVLDTNFGYLLPRLYLNQDGTRLAVVGQNSYKAFFLRLYSLDGSPDSPREINITNRQNRPVSMRLDYNEPKQVLFNPNNDSLVLNFGYKVKVAIIPLTSSVLIPTDGIVSDIAYTADGRYLAVACDRTISVWNSDIQEVARVCCDEPVKMVDAGLDGRYLLSVGGTVRLWDAQEQLPDRLESNSSAIAVSGDGRFVAAQDEDGNLVISHLIKGDPLHTIQINNLQHADLNQDGRYLLTQDDDKTVSLRSVGNPAQPLRQWPARNFTLSPDGGYVAIITDHQNNTSCQVWKLPDQLISDIPLPTRDAPLFNLSKDGRYLAVQGVADIGRPNTSQLMVQENLPGDTTSPGTVKATLRVWRVADQKIIIDWRNDLPRFMYFSPDGRFLVISHGKTNTLWPIQDTAHPRTIGSDMDSPVAFSAQDSLCVFAKDNCIIGKRLSDFSEVFRQWVGHSIQAMTFTQDGRFLATASGRVISLWDVAQLKSRESDAEHTFLEVARINNPELVAGLFFNTDEEYLMVLGENNPEAPTHARAYHWRPKDMLVDAKNCLAGYLTRDEWNRYLKDETYRKTFPKL